MMVAMGTTTLLTLEEFERINQGADHIELLRGELIRVPPAQLKHNLTRERLYKLLDAAVESRRKTTAGARLGNVHTEMGYLLFGEPRSWLQPDVSITRPDQPGERYYEGAPLIVFEIVSAYDTAKDLEAKVAEYLANGSAEVWVIYPERRYAWVYGPSSKTARQETQAIRSELLPEIEIPLSDIL
jgi:Uma2 family endonuclease